MVEDTGLIDYLHLACLYHSFLNCFASAALVVADSTTYTSDPHEFESRWIVALRHVAGLFVGVELAARCEVLPFVSHLMETPLLRSMSAHLLC